MDIKEIKEKVAAYFCAKPEIITGYIFGSIAKGEEKLKKLKTLLITI